MSHMLYKVRISSYTQYALGLRSLCNVTATDILSYLKISPCLRKEVFVSEDRELIL